MFIYLYIKYKKILYYIKKIQYLIFIFLKLFLIGII